MVNFLEKRKFKIEALLDTNSMDFKSFEKIISRPTYKKYIDIVKNLQKVKNNKFSNFIKKINNLYKKLKKKLFLVLYVSPEGYQVMFIRNWSKLNAYEVILKTAKNKRELNKFGEVIENMRNEIENHLEMMVLHDKLMNNYKF